MVSTMPEGRSSSRVRRLAGAVAASAFAVLIFHGVSLASGKLGEGRGLGWDGQRYAEMVTGSLYDGTANTRTRPLIVLVTRIPYVAGMSVVDSFHLLNYVYAFALYALVWLLLDRYGAPPVACHVIVANLALCVSTSKMFAYYPAQIDLGALAITTLAFHLAAIDRHRSAGIVCVAAVAAREFGIAPALYGFHRAVRTGRSWGEAILTYGPGIAMMVAIRWWAASRPGRGAPLSAADAVDNLAFLASPAFVIAFLYFSLVIFGGISMVLVLRPRWCLERLRTEPELATFLAIIVAMTMAGNLDIWRYLVFALPVAVVLIAQYWTCFDTTRTWRVLFLITIVTVVTQRPLEAMTRTTYFRDWFPLYPYFDAQPRTDDFLAVWLVRLTATVLITLSVLIVMRQPGSVKRGSPGPA
jgi:hypothetical protein